MLHITKEAARQVHDLLEREGWQGYGLRVGLKDGGCSGSTYLLDFEATPEEDDMVVEEHGVKLFVHPTHLPYVRGSVIGWKDELMETGFKIDNPNVKGSCGCGVSVQF